MALRKTPTSMIRTKGQYKFVTSEVTSNGIILSFNNLDIGTRYRAMFNAFYAVSGDGANIIFSNAGQTLPKMELFTFTTADINTIKQVEVTFVATATILSFVADSFGTDDKIFGNNSFSDSWAYLELDDDFELTTEWT